MANSVDPDQTAPIGAVCSGSRLFASILNSSVMLGNYLQQTTSAGNILRVNSASLCGNFCHLLIIFANSKNIWSSLIWVCVFICELELV